MAVNTVHPTYDLLREKWERCRDCVDGGDAVKGKGVKYLPILPSHIENFKRYNEYKQRALFYNATGRTVEGLAGGIFQKAPVLKLEENAALEEQMKDVTLSSQPADMFALNTTKEHLTTGRFGVLVDMATEEAVLPRPYWVGYAAEDIINWRYKNMGGDQELSMVVLRENTEEGDESDEFKVIPTVKYRVLRLRDGIYTSQLYTEVKGTNGGTEYAPEKEIVPQRFGAALNFIPFVLPSWIGNPPILDLVDVNLSHYRGYADLKHGLHFTALPTPWVAGHTSKSNKPLRIGSGTAWVLDKDGQAGMLEFTGKGLEAIRKDLQDMQRVMATLGARLLEEAPRYAETATAVSMRHSGDYASLRTLGQIVEQQLSYVMKIHHWWIDPKLKTPEDSKVGLELNKIFYDQTITADELRALLLALQSNSMSFKSFYQRLSNAGWMREGVDDAEELKDIQEQPPIIGMAPLATATKLKPEEKLAPS